MLSALVLYGSRARGDFHDQSDIDLLGVVPAGRIEGSSIQQAVNLHLRPFDQLIQQASEGNLFVAHLVYEGRVLHDSTNTFAQVRAAFRWADSYAEERRIATLVSDYLTTFDATSDRPELIKRLVWAIRTLIIAHAAEQQLPIFAARAMADHVGIARLEIILNGREQASMRPAILSMARRVRRMLGRGTFRADRTRRFYESRLTSAGGIAAATVNLVNRTSYAADEPEYV